MLFAQTTRIHVKLRLIDWVNRFNFKKYYLILIIVTRIPPILTPTYDNGKVNSVHNILIAIQNIRK